MFDTNDVVDINKLEEFITQNRDSIINDESDTFGIDLSGMMVVGPAVIKPNKYKKEAEETVAD